MNNIRGYTLVEALIAASLLIIAIAAAVTLTLTMTAQEEANQEFSRAINYHEQAARLFQLGLSPTTIAQILPEEPVVDSLTFNVSDTTITGVGVVEAGTCTVVVQSPKQQLDGMNSTDDRTLELTVVRPSIR